MANHKSAVKRARQTVKKNAHNRTLRSGLRSIHKKLRAAITENDKDTASKLLVTFQSTVAKLNSKGLLKKNTSARLTSRAHNQVNSL